MSFQADPSKIFGRDKKIESIWKLLARGKSIRFTAERRIGKTSVMQKMRAEPKAGYIPVLIDLERVHSPIRFVEVLAQECNTHQSIAKKLVGFVKKYMGESIEVQGVKISLPSNPDWRTTLDDLFADLCAKADDQVILLLLDEIPYMLQNIYRGDEKDGEQNALEILDILRAIRHKYPNIRMIFTGSVGLHHVLQILKSRGSTSQPLNDLDIVTIESLQTDAAVACLNYFCEAIDLTANLAQKQRIAELCNYVPFYMDKVVNKLDLLDRENGVVNEDIEEVFHHLLSSDADEWQMAHFAERLKIYYAGEYRDAANNPRSRAELAVLMLNECAQASSALAVEEIYNLITAKIQLNSQDLIRDLLSDLAQDHYLVSHLDDQNTKKYRFTYTLIQRWWCVRYNLRMPRGLV